MEEVEDNEMAKDENNTIINPTINTGITSNCAKQLYDERSLSYPSTKRDMSNMFSR